VEAQIATGAYADHAAVLRDALDGLERRHRSLDHLRDMVREADEDIATGRVGFFDVDATLRAVETPSPQRQTPVRAPEE
jgi:Arc/MetJ-type ribon-helix-helix transcriptional regulator